MNREQYLCHRNTERNSSDVLMGYLDLPAFELSKEQMESYLKLMALFYDHLYIPDGWMHCSGPISQYLLGRLKEAKFDPGNKIFSDNIFFGLLKEKVIIPLLRGRRPANTQQEPIGWDFFKVWSGDCYYHTTNSGDTKKREDFGVYYEKSNDRMTILDPEDENNCTIIKSISNNIKAFADWTSPELPITEIIDTSTNSPGALDRWDNEFKQKSLEMLIDSPLALSNLEDISILAKAGFDVNLIKRFLNNVKEQVEPLKRGEKFRRGTIERILANQLEIPRLTSYGLLGRRRRFILNRRNEFNVGGFLSRLYLNRITTLQEHLFADKLNSAISYCNGLSHDIEDVFPSKQCTKVPIFTNYNDKISNTFVGLDSLELDSILQLRDKARTGYLRALVEARLTPNFWQDNNDLREQVRGYVNAITGMTGPSKKVKRVSHFSTSLGIHLMSHGVVAFSCSGGAGLVIEGMMIPLLWLAENKIPPIQRIFLKRFNDPFGHLINESLSKKRTDIILDMLGVPSDLRTDV